MILLVVGLGITLILPLQTSGNVGAPEEAPSLVNFEGQRPTVALKRNQSFKIKWTHNEAVSIASVSFWITRPHRMEIARVSNNNVLSIINATYSSYISTFDTTGLRLMPLGGLWNRAELSFRFVLTPVNMTTRVILLEKRYGEVRLHAKEQFRSAFEIPTEMGISRYELLAIVIGLMTLQFMILGTCRYIYKRIRAKSFRERLIRLQSRPLMKKKGGRISGGQEPYHHF